ncbi:hypothetical protein STEG23_016250 [Scotinomys teguina]
MCRLSWFLDPGGWSKAAAVGLYFIFPGICTLSLIEIMFLQSFKWDPPDHDERPIPDRIYLALVFSYYKHLPFGADSIMRKVLAYCMVECDTHRLLSGRVGTSAVNFKILPMVTMPLTEEPSLAVYPCSLVLQD